MIYPWLYLFLSLVAGITFNIYINIDLPVYVPILFIILSLFIPNAIVSYILLIFSSFLTGISISYHQQINIKPQTAFVECISLSTTKGSFNCKVINSDIRLLEGKVIKVYSENKDIFFLSRVGFIGRVDSYKNQIRAFPTKEFIKVENKNNPLYVIKDFKDNLINNYRYTALNADTFNLGLGLIFGDRGEISQSDYKSFVKSGLAHFLAISASHIAILMVTLNYSLFFISQRIRYIMMIFLLPVYAIFTGLAIPVVRATFVAFFYYFAKIKYLRFNSINTLFFVGYIYLLLFPDSLTSASFQLSFIAAFSIIVGIEIFKQYSTIYKVLGISFIATIFTSPVVMYHFGNISLNSILSTPIASLPLYPYLFLAFINTLTGFSIEPIIKLMDGFGLMFLSTVKLFETFPLYFIGFSPSLSLITIFYITLILIIFSNLKTRLKIGSIFVAFILFSLLSKSELKQFMVYSFQGKDYPTLMVVSGNRCYLVSNTAVYKQLSLFDKEGCEVRFLLTQNPEKFKDDYLSLFSHIYPYNYEITTEDFTLKKWVQFRIYRNGKEYIIKNQDGELDFE